MLPIRTIRPTSYLRASDLSSTFDSLFETVFPSRPFRSLVGQAYETFRFSQTEDGDWEVFVPHPGVDPARINVTVDNKVLVVTVNPEVEEAEATETERSSDVVEADTNRVTRSVWKTEISLPESADASKVVADSKHGLLTVSIPSAVSEAREVRVTSS